MATTLSPTDVQMKIAELQTMLQTKHPQMPVLLREIHLTLKEDPTCVTLLNDVEVGTIVAGLQQFTGNFITAKATTSRSTVTKAALARLTADDL